MIFMSKDWFEARQKDLTNTIKLLKADGADSTRCHYDCYC